MTEDSLASCLFTQTLKLNGDKIKHDDDTRQMVALVQTEISND